MAADDNGCWCRRCATAIRSRISGGRYCRPDGAWRRIFMLGRRRSSDWHEIPQLAANGNVSPGISGR
jgi:hypothetical protein